MKRRRVYDPFIGFIASNQSIEQHEQNGELHTKEAMIEILMVSNDRLFARSNHNKKTQQEEEFCFQSPNIFVVWSLSSFSDPEC